MSVPRARRPVHRSEAGVSGRTEVESHSSGLFGPSEPASSPPPAGRPALLALNSSDLPFRWTVRCALPLCFNRGRQRAANSLRLFPSPKNQNQSVYNGSPMRDRSLWPQDSPGITTQIPARPAQELSCVQVDGRPDREGVWS